VRFRSALALVVVVLLIAAFVMIRARTAPGPAESYDAEAPVVAPSRVISTDGESRVALDTAEARRIGLTTAVLAPAEVEAGRRLTGQVVPEPERIAILRAPVAGRLRAADGQPWPGLGERLAAGTTIGRVSDAQPLAVPLSAVVTRVGARPGEIVEAGQVLLELADISRPVVRIAWPEDAGRARPRIMLVPSGNAPRVKASLIGPATEADPLTRLPAYLYRAISRWPGAVPGTPVAAVVMDEEHSQGVLVPDRAVVQWEGLAWAYVRRGGGEYARVRVPTTNPVPGGWIAGDPFSPGDTVVVNGVQELLSEEFRARVTVGEESGE
jgi:hypothetical protein